jgi:aldose 1-epimerase
MQLCVINYGATFDFFKSSIDRRFVDVVLGFDDLESYINSFDLKAPYLGATVGRFAGRIISEGSFILNDKRIDLSINGNSSWRK